MQERVFAGYSFEVNSATGEIMEERPVACESDVYVLPCVLAKINKKKVKLIWPGKKSCLLAGGF